MNKFPASLRSDFSDCRFTPVCMPACFGIGGDFIGILNKVQVVESVDPEKPAKDKGEPTENFITEILTTEAAQDEMAGMAEALRTEKQHHGNKPPEMYADGGYVTERTLTEAEQNGMALLGPVRPDPHKGPYNADAFHVDIDKRQAVCPQGNTSTQCSHIKDAYLGTEYYRIEWGSQCDSCP